MTVSEMYTPEVFQKIKFSMAGKTFFEYLYIHIEDKKNNKNNKKKCVIKYKYKQLQIFDIGDLFKLSK